jgi:hypothetical protein
MRSYRVTCLECEESDVLQIDDLNHVVGETEKKLITNFLSYRWRPDQQWGFMCKCGNDNRLAPQEADDFDKLVAGDPITVKKIAASLLIPDEKQFKFEVA